MAVTVAERYADGAATRRELKRAWRAAEAAAVRDMPWLAIQLYRLQAEDWDRDPYDGRMGVAAMTASTRLETCILEISSFACDMDCDRQFQVSLLYDICGPLPFRRVVSDPQWLLWRDATVATLAQTAYHERAFDLVPILGDALEDAGCRDADILTHCRQRIQHIRGCWVLDLLLGKE